jgi:hypothetical protein
MPRLPVLKPTTILRLVITTAARTEFPAAARFSERINSDEGMAGLPDMQELSLLRAESAKQIAARSATLRRARTPAATAGETPALRSTAGGREGRLC